MKLKIISILLAFIILCSALGMSSYFYFDLNNKHIKLQLDYNLLINKYDLLQSNYNDLSRNYTKLKNDFNNLSIQWSTLFNNYNTLLEVFNNPLFYEEVPSISELEEWLIIDRTDQLQYIMPNFICGDFATMLSFHAKMKYWDCGLVAVFGHTQNNEAFAHAFNGIICQEGLVYIEPQSDRVWWYSNHISMSGGIGWWEFPDFGYIYVQQYIIILLYD